MDEAHFDGAVVLVTGGTTGIGHATAHAFARRGATVVIAARNAESGEAVEAELTDVGAKAAFIATDVSQAEDVQNLFDTVIDRFGRVDCAVNNAASGEIGMFKPTAELSEDEFDGHIALNLKSVWLCMRHELEWMQRDGHGGTIVNTSSVNGLGGVPHGALYAAAKAGILALTKSAAQEYAQQGIRVNALVPGPFQTPLLQQVFEHSSPDDPDAAAEGTAGRVPMGRIGEPREAAEAVLWLCSDAASYVTGHSLIVDGGATSPFR